MLYLTATIAWTDSPLLSSGAENDSVGGDDKASPEGTTRVQVRVDSKIRNVEHGETKPTGQFNYTFEVKGDLKVVPQTYSDFMVFLDARRRAKRVEAVVARGEGGAAKGGGEAREDVMG